MNDINLLELLRAEEALSLSLSPACLLDGEGFRSSWTIDRSRGSEARVKSHLQYKKVMQKDTTAKHHLKILKYFVHVEVCRFLFMLKGQGS